ncbi:MAG: hypothetical protein VKL60_16270 [Sphaerospermopsis sp.]|nr:hypothetical protein [Sphaerospermopsis sp.]
MMLNINEYKIDEEELECNHLSSCIAICVHDTNARSGGMFHYNSGTIDEFMSFFDKQTSVVLLYGGGSYIPELQASGKINADYVVNWLESNGYTIKSKELGGNFVRSVRFYPETGIVQFSASSYNPKPVRK